MEENIEETSIVPNHWGRNPSGPAPYKYHPDPHSLLNLKKFYDTHVWSWTLANFISSSNIDGDVNRSTANMAIPMMSGGHLLCKDYKQGPVVGQWTCSHRTLQVCNESMQLKQLDAQQRQPLSICENNIVQNIEVL